MCQMEQNTYGEGERDSNMTKEWEERDVGRAKLFDKGQSKRIWAELYKVCIVRSRGEAIAKGQERSRRRKVVRSAVPPRKVCGHADLAFVSNTMLRVCVRCTAVGSYTMLLKDRLMFYGCGGPGAGLLGCSDSGIGREECPWDSLPSSREAPEEKCVSQASYLRD